MSTGSISSFVAGMTSTQVVVAGAVGVVTLAVAVAIFKKIYPKAQTSFVVDPQIGVPNARSWVSLNNDQKTTIKDGGAYSQYSEVTDASRVEELNG